MGRYKGQRNYLLGTEVQEKSGRVKKKVADLDGAKWVSRGRYNYMREHKIDLDPNQRIFHANGDCADDSPQNLVCIRFAGKHYDLIHSKVVYHPPQPKKAPVYFGRRQPLEMPEKQAISA